jgi:hypothetical protein
MKLKTIMEKQERENAKFEVAKKMRLMLDEARNAYGDQQWDDDCVENEIADLVFAEDED